MHFASFLWGCGSQLGPPEWSGSPIAKYIVILYNTISVKYVDKNYDYRTTCGETHFGPKLIDHNIPRKSIPYPPLSDSTLPFHQHQETPHLHLAGP